MPRTRQQQEEYRDKVRAKIVETMTHPKYLTGGNWHWTPKEIEMVHYEVLIEDKVGATDEVMVEVTEITEDEEAK